MATSSNQKETFSSITEYLDQVEKQMNSTPDGSGSPQTFERPASAGSGPRRAFEADTEAEADAGVQSNDEIDPVRRSTASRSRWRATRDAVRDRNRLRLVEDLDKKAQLQRDRMKVRIARTLKIQ